MVALAGPDPQEIAHLQWGGVKGKTGWDVGANAGQTVARMVDLFSRVVAFEPAWESFRLLETAYSGDPRVTLKRIAVSDHEGKVELSVREAPIMTGQLVTVGMPFRGEHQGDVPNMANWGQEITTRSVRCATLDTLVRELGRPDFVKIDTEGHEIHILRGAQDLLAGGNTEWLVEFHDKPLREQALKIFADAGYRTEIIGNPHHEPESYMWYRHGWFRAFPPGDSNGSA